LFLVLIGAGSASAQADGYPSRTVKVIVPLAAGGPIDTVARTVAETLSARLKQSFIVENRPGAGGNIGILATITAKPDGYTLLVAAGSMVTVNPLLYRRPPFDPARDLQPLSTLTVSSQMLVVPPSLPVKSLRDLVAYARTGRLPYATSGNGSPSHLAMEYLRLLAGFPATPIPYRGLSALMVDLLSGQVKAGFIATSGALPYLRQGKLRGIAISSARRSPLAKQIPTVAESGYPEFVFDSYVVMLAPAHVPDAVAGLLEREIRRAVTLPEFETVYLARDVVGVGNSSADTRTWMVRETSRWAKVVKAADIHAE
jgi:tripartite-type tricarboxylate transporter receptor subunit TctC